MKEPGDNTFRIPHQLNVTAFKKSVAKGCSLCGFALCQKLVIGGDLVVDNIDDEKRQIVHTEPQIFVQLERGILDETEALLCFRYMEVSEFSPPIRDKFATFELDVAVNKNMKRTLKLIFNSFRRSGIFFVAPKMACAKFQQPASF